MSGGTKSGPGCRRHPWEEEPIESLDGDSVEELAGQTEASGKSLRSPRR